MSEENVEVIRAIYAAWDARDLDALLELTDPDIEFRTSGYFPDFEPIYRGHQGLRSFWKTMLVPWDESFRIDVEHIVEWDDCAAVAIRFRARGKGSGVLTDLRQGHAMHFENGRAVKLSAHTSFEEALEAAGLSE
jgi:ketosteroid isomerase-like protein